MQFVGSISIDEFQDPSRFKSGHDSGLHLVLPVGFITLVILTLFTLEYYKEWKRRRRLNRFWEKPNAPRNDPTPD